MSAMEHLSEWRACVCEELFPDLHKHQSKTLADLSFAVLAAASCQSGLVAAAVPGLVRTAGCDLLEFVGDKVAKKNAFRKQRG